MRDVARAAGVHQTTVSLALRDHPSLPSSTRKRIKALAKRLGYRQDPMLGALNYYRVSGHAAKAPQVIAALLSFQDEAALHRAPFHVRESIESATRHATKLGYRLDRFYLSHENPGPESRRVQDILLARGIHGVIIASFREPMPGFQLDWDQFSTVQIESQQLGISVHTISSDQTRMTRDCVAQLYARGYRRIGLATGREEENYLGHPFTVGYQGELMLHRGLAQVPPLLLQNGEVAERLAPGLSAWVKENRLDCVISNWPKLAEIMRGAGWRIPADIAMACIGVQPGYGPAAGVRQRDDVVGERAIEQLALMLKTYQRGLVAVPNFTMIRGDWIDGPEAPPRHPQPARSLKKSRRLEQK